MNASSDAIQKWCEELDQYQPQPWERMPEIYLYIDRCSAIWKNSLAFLTGTVKGF